MPSSSSCPHDDNARERKLVAILSDSVGNLGTGRAQYHLRQTGMFLNMRSLNRPQVMINNACKRFDEHGKLTDEDTRVHIRKLPARRRGPVD